MFIVGILVGAGLGIVGVLFYPFLGLWSPLLGMFIGACAGGVAGVFTLKRSVVNYQRGIEVKSTMCWLDACFGIFAATIVGGIIGLIATFLVLTILYGRINNVQLLTGIAFGALLGGFPTVVYVRPYIRELREIQYAKSLVSLPENAANLIKLIIGQMRYRKEVQDDVMTELAAHFEDELRDCKTEEEKEQRVQQLIGQFGDVKLLGVLLRRAKKRCRPLWRKVVARSFQTAGVLILCLIAYIVWFITGKPVVTTDYLAEFNRLARPFADENLNAAPLFEQAAAMCPNRPEEKSDFWQKSFIDANETERRVIKVWVQLCSDSLNLITQGTEKPYFWRLYETYGGAGDDGSMLGTLLPHISKFRNIARAFCLRAQIQAVKGEYSSAFGDLMVCYKLGKLTGQGERTIVEQLVGMGIQTRAAGTIREILSRYPVGAEELSVLQTDLAEVQTGQEFRIKLLFDRLAIYDEIQRSFTEDRLGGGHLYPERIFALSGEHGGDRRVVEIVLENLLDPENWKDAARFMFFNPNKTQTKQQADAFYASFEETSKMSPAQLRKKEVDLNKEFESAAKGNIFLRIMMPALGSVYKTIYRVKVDVQSVPLIVAVLRFRIDKGQYPDDLAELQRFGYIREIPIDPWSEKPLVYKRTVDNFTLYSVGLNFKDDGGKVCRDEKGKVKLWGDEADAVFWPVQK
jgi:hypothetical protein